MPENLKHETGFVQQNPGNRRANGSVQKGMGRWATDLYWRRAEIADFKALNDDWRPQVAAAKGSNAAMFHESV
jgi:hypothetical protein